MDGLKAIIMGICFIIALFYGREDENAKNEKRLQYQGVITTLRIDDDSEYHFSTDYITESDVNMSSIQIERSDVKEPSLYIKQYRRDKKDVWHNDIGYKLILPYNYKIGTFQD